MPGHLLDETLGDVCQCCLSLNRSRHHIALHHIFTFTVLQLLCLKHDAVQVVLVIEGCEGDILQYSFAI